MVSKRPWPQVIPESVLRALWQRYDKDHNGVLDESELEELMADLNEMRRGEREGGRTGAERAPAVADWSNTRVYTHQLPWLKLMAPVVWEDLISVPWNVKCGTARLFY